MLWSVFTRFIISTQSQPHPLLHYHNRFTVTTNIVMWNEVGKGRGILVQLGKRKTFTGHAFTGISSLYTRTVSPY